VDRIFAETGLDSLWATTSIDNLPAQKVLQKAGFIFQGEYPESFIINAVPVKQHHYIARKS
jgi:RimJ/RimL family protein N-acetyltransferase